MSTALRAPSLYLAHGGGPMPVIMPDTAISKFLKNLAWPQILTDKAGTPTPPKAILLVTAHWEEPD
ncbi:hypothetical protein HDU93_004962, partial [Gonapodya sp. JEL0774]